MKIRLIVADDHRILQESLSKLLIANGFEVIARASDGEEAVLLAREHHPHMILMDLEMPSMDGIVATQMIKRHLPSVKILILSAYGDQGRVMEAMRAGATGYILKRVGPEDLIRIIQATAEGEFVFSPYLANLILSDQLKAQRGEESGNPEASDLLSSREQSILNLIVDGRSNDEISETIHVSRDTVKVHLRHIFDKLRVRNRTEAAVAALERKLYHPA